MSTRFQWTESKIEILRTRYPNERAADIAATFNVKVNIIYCKAYLLGLKKSQEFYDGPNSGQSNLAKGAGTRFKKGQQTWNKNLKGLQIGGEATQFKKGNIPQNYKPLGSTRIDVDGYVWIKTAEPRTYEMQHRVNWRQKHGSLPAKGYALIFKDGNRQNCDIENLELVNRAELMKRNTVHNLPKELAELVQLRGVLNRKINRRIKNEQY